MRSMTGFGVGAAPHRAGRLVAEARSVNGRFLDVRVRLPRELSELTSFAEHLVRKKLRRGRVELVIRLENAPALALALDRDRAREVFASLTQLRDELAPGTEVPLSILGAVPDLFLPPTGEAFEAVRTALAQAIESSTDALLQMAEREGRDLAADLAARLSGLCGHTDALESATAVMPDVARARLLERISKLISPSELSTAQGERIAAEVVLLADRADVTEELTRLRAHFDHMQEVLEGASATPAASAEPVGRRLDFLLQEMVRETNTLGSKAQDVTISRVVVLMKTELERMREQVQNVE